MSDAPTHGQRRLGLLTSSKAHVIMHGRQRAWDSLRGQLWAEEAADFDQQVKSGARAFGHEHEAEGAAKFWDRHPEYELREGGFHEYTSDDSMCGWLGSSPDRKLVFAHVCATITAPHGLEIKSPVDAATFERHGLRQHIDQCQHGMLVTGWPVWWLVVHHGDLYREWRIERSIEWQVRYLQRARAFKDFCYAGRPVKRRRLSVLDL